MKRFSDRLYGLISKKVLITSVVIFVVFVAVANPLAAKYMDRLTGGAPSPDTSFFYNKQEILQMAEDYGQEGRDGYILMRFTFDLAFPLLYLFFLAAALTKLLSYFPQHSRLRPLNLLPFLAAGFDLIENILAAIVMGRYPQQAAAAAQIAPYASAVKWLFVIASFALAAVLAVYRLVSYLAMRKKA